MATNRGDKGKSTFPRHAGPMPQQKRLRSLDEFTPLPWHRRRASRALGVPMILSLVIAISIGALIGIFS
ncbi:hypothetical protein NF699_09480 [Sphingomonadaceae bacterium OTU29LAMAA1]|jgi:hypothetical protein|nr:hypothetical protein NF699_09480 [Sphingomonadaceae bacterium OTU29LAMAA1]